MRRFPRTGDGNGELLVQRDTLRRGTLGGHVKTSHRRAEVVDAHGITRPRSHRRDSHRRRHRFSGQTRGGRYSRARYYHPTLQRFVSEDPVEFGAGDVNLYAYVVNQPTSVPSGKSC